MPGRPRAPAPRAGRPTDAPGRDAGRRASSGSRSIGRAGARQRGADRAAPAPRGGRAARRGRRAKGGVRRVDPVAEHVHVARRRHTAVTSMPGTSVEAAARAASGRASATAGDGVVVGDARTSCTPAACTRATSSRGAAAAVGGGRVQVEVDHVDGRGLRGTRGRAASRRAWRFGPACRRVTSARYSRISSSRCSRSSSANSRKICLPSESSNRSP